MSLRPQTAPEIEEIALDIDPVCGATIDPGIARELDLGISFAEREYLFCGPKCRDRFVHEPLTYSAAGRDAP